MKGFFSQLLRINLSHQKFTVQPISESILRSYLGGKGLGSYLLLKENPPHIDPFSSENRLPRAFNQQDGVTKKRGQVPGRFFREVLQDTGKTIQLQDLKLMLKEYYQLRGWNRQAKSEIHLSSKTLCSQCP